MRTLTLAWSESESAVSYYTYNDEPNSVDISRTVSSELLPTFLVISGSEANQIILDSRRSESFQQVFKTLTFRIRWRHRLTYDDSFLFYLSLAHVLEYTMNIGNDTHQHPMRLQTQDAHRSPLLGDTLALSGVQLCLAYRRYGRASIRVLLLKANSESPSTKAIFNGTMYTSRFLCCSQITLFCFVGSESCYWRTTA